MKFRLVIERRTNICCLNISGGVLPLSITKGGAHWFNRFSCDLRERRSEA